MNLIKQNKLEVLLLTLIVLLALFLRLYRIDAYMTFLGDEGRDALVIKGILVDHHVPLLGPPTSVGMMYLGPLYYYMMAVPMALFWLNPVAAAVMDALIGVGIVFLVYLLAKIWFEKWGALLGAFLYAVSPITIVYSKSSWNPNPTPFFTLLSFLGFYKAHQTKNYWWLILTGVSLAFAVQMHYLALILLPIFGILWLWEIRVKGGRRGNFAIGTATALVIFLILMSPLALFDLRHDLMNFHAFQNIFFGKDKAVGFNPLKDIINFFWIYINNLIGRYMAGENLILALLLAVLIIVPLKWQFWRVVKKKDQIRWSTLALGVWLLVGLVFLTILNTPVYDHYLVFLNPVPYLLLAGFIFILPKKFRIPTVVVLAVLVGFVNLIKNPLQYPPNNQLQKTQEVAKFVISKAQGRPYNFALIAKSNYDSAYQFYLDQYGFPPKKVPFEKTDQLFVVCEDNPCTPNNNPKYEVAGFGMSKIEEEYSVEGLKVYKLVANPSGKPY
jgi:4-amino-4-deoxy-L-arabinose transferase-like glycosyltransferase